MAYYNVRQNVVVENTRYIQDSYFEALLKFGDAQSVSNIDDAMLLRLLTIDPQDFANLVDKCCCDPLIVRTRLSILGLKISAKTPTSRDIYRLCSQLEYSERAIEELSAEYDVFEALLENDAPMLTGECLDRVCKYDKLALLKACSNDEQVALEMIAKRWHLDVVNIDGVTPLMEACYCKMERAALALLDSGKSTPEKVNAYGDTALIYACYSSMEIALKLIESDAGIPYGQVNDIQHTALIQCCMKKKMDQVALKLIATGQSNPSQVSYKGMTALMYAVNNNLVNVALALIATGQSNPGHVKPKSCAPPQMTHYHYGMMEYKTQHKCRNRSEYFEADGIGFTALMVACFKNLTQVALALIETNESNPGHINQQSDTALIIACKHGLSLVAVALMKTGQALPEHVDACGKTALMYARDVFKLDIESW
jgi:ankyrin repeat protein